MIEKKLLKIEKFTFPFVFIFFLQKKFLNSKGWFDAYKPDKEQIFDELKWIIFFFNFQSNLTHSLKKMKKLMMLEKETWNSFYQKEKLSYSQHKNIE